MRRASTHYYKLYLTLFGALFCLPHKTLASDIHVVRYAKDDLRQQSEDQFIRPPSLADVAITKLKEIMITATARQSGGNASLRDLALNSRELSKRDWMKKMASLSFDPDSSRSRIDESLMKKTLMSQGKKAAEITLKNDFPVFQQFQKGLTFNLNFGDERKNPGKKIRYGLIERDIIPSETPIQLAAYGSINDLYRSYATQATVIYTIDRVEYPGQAGRPVMPTEPSPDVTSARFSWHKMPSPKMVVKIDSATNDATAADSSLSAAPGVRVRMSQVDGLVSTQVILGSKSLEKSLSTEIALPLTSSIKLSQKFDHKLRLSEVTAAGLIEDWHESKINVVYSHASQAMRGEWLFVRDRINYGLSAEAASLERSGVFSRVSLGLNKSF